MAAIVMHKSNMNIGHQNLSRSLERILEDAALSGELKLSCRKLKDFPKIISKYNLSDTVIAGKLTSIIYKFTFLVLSNQYKTNIPSIIVKQEKNETFIQPSGVCFFSLVRYVGTNITDSTGATICGEVFFFSGFMNVSGLVFSQGRKSHYTNRSSNNTTMIKIFRISSFSMVLVV